MVIKVLLTDEIMPAGIEALKKEAEIIQAKDPSMEAVLQLVNDVDGIISRNTKIDKRIFEKAPKLKAVASHGVGYDHIDVDAATRHGVCVVNTPGANAQSVAELAVSMMLALSRKLIPADNALRIKKDYYARNQCLGQDINGKTIAIIGMGLIGQKLAKICLEGFGMKVLGFDPYVSSEQMAKLGAVKAETVDEMLPAADFVSLNCPYTPESHHLIDGRRLALMKPAAFLINCARGQLLDEQALYQAIQKGRIAGAGLDVYDPEPPAKDNPLFTLPAVITTPHIGANAVDSINRMSLLSAQDVLAVIKGEPPKTRIVNKEVLQG